MSEALVFRADAGPRMGTGHVMRCLALAQGWGEAGGRSIFVTVENLPALETRLKEEKMEVVRLGGSPGSADDAGETVRLAKKEGASWVVLDGYHFGEGFQRTIKNSSLRLLTIDDTGKAGRYCSDFVLNQNLHARESLYTDRDPGTRLLLGTRYVLLRKDFLRWRGRSRETRKFVRRILITLGGGDPGNALPATLEALCRLRVRKLEVTVVTGGGCPHGAELRAAAEKAGADIRILNSPSAMDQLMAQADVAVAAGGTTAWEMAFMGLPFLVLVLADNQRLVAEELAAAGIAEKVGKSFRPEVREIARALEEILEDWEKRVLMASRGRKAVDGEGVDRVVMRLKGSKIRVRPAREEDCRLYWKWVNDPGTRAAAFDSAPILWDRHVAWFNSKLEDSGCRLYVGLNGMDTPVGQVRFDVQGEEAEVDVSVDKGLRKSGHGSGIIGQALRDLFRHTPVRTVHALVKTGNEPSVRAFEKAGFTLRGSRCVKNTAVHHYVRVRKDENGKRG